MRLEINKLTYVVKGFLDALIPQSDSKLLPSGSDAINVDLFIDFISSNEHSKNILFKNIPNDINDITHKKKLIEIGSNLSKSKELVALIEEYIIKHYFTSNIVLKLLSSRDTLGDIDYSEKLVKKRLLNILNKN
tara:strand:+ start:841 stop:1242 length:402 start_codon:yes stop_codon:yes gene_type:complete